MEQITFTDLPTYHGRELHGQCKCDKCGIVTWSCMGYHGSDNKTYCGKCKINIENNSIEKFKSICKDIGYEYKGDYEIDKIKATIFTQDFMNKYAYYFHSEFLGLGDEIGKCMDNLDNIIDYLYENIQESEQL